MATLFRPDESLRAKVSLFSSTNVAACPVDVVVIPVDYHLRPRTAAGKRLFSLAGLSLANAVTAVVEAQ